MDYQVINETIRKTYMNVLLANEADALEAARHMAEWLGVDDDMVTAIHDEITAFATPENAITPVNPNPNSLS